MERSGELVETALAKIARALVQRGVGQLLVAGGETAGVCIRALEVDQMQIGPQIDPGVPWCWGSTPLASAGGNSPGPEVREFRRQRFLHKSISDDRVTP